jgi:hypothetical protein
MKELGWLVGITTSILIYLAIRDAAKSVSASVSNVNQDLSSFFEKWDRGANISQGDQGGLDVTPLATPESSFYATPFATGLSQLAYDATIVEGT